MAPFTTHELNLDKSFLFQEIKIKLQQCRKNFYLNFFKHQGLQVYHFLHLQKYLCYI